MYAGGLEVPIVCDVGLHRVHHVEGHVAAQLGNGAVRGIGACNLVGGLLKLATVGGDLVIGLIRKSQR